MFQIASGDSVWGDGPEMVDLLLAQGADIEGRNNRGKTPFLEACGTGNVDVARHLLDIGADVQAPS
eukprot:1326169-Alexandrium_andersonii.AAC.1